jgi:hypothetical protein
VARAVALVVEHVIALALEQPQVRRNVVAFVAILVVDPLFFVKMTPKNCLGHKSMLKAVPPKVRIGMIRTVLILVRTIIHCPTDISTREKSDR